MLRKRLTEIFKYGDTEAVEILLSISILAEVTILSAKWVATLNLIPGLLMAVIIISANVLIVESLSLNCSKRKKASYITFICTVGLLIYLIDHGIASMEYYILLGVQSVGFIWIAWKNAIEERWKKSITK